ncbi:MAG: hypothetical protein IJI43_00005, partial [Bacilli bacterium]|nr:hypothetical protein [Bacilli bacterium]
IKLIYDITGYKLNNIVLTITELPIIRKNEKFKKCDILIRSKDLEKIQININNYSRFNKPILDYRIINNSYGIVYFNGLKIYDLDIVKSKKLYYNEYIRKRNYLKWEPYFHLKH